MNFKKSKQSNPKTGNKILLVTISLLILLLCTWFFFPKEERTPKDLETLSAPPTPTESSTDITDSYSYDGPKKNADITPIEPAPSEEPNDSKGPKEVAEVVNSFTEEKIVETLKPFTKEELHLLPSTTIIDMSLYPKYKKEFFFYSVEIEDPFPDSPSITTDDLRYIRVLHYGFDEEVHIGELIVNKQIVSLVTDIFYELFLAEYPIEKMILIKEYDGDDNASMADNNTSAFNYRNIAGSSSLSKHSMGLAIDINPLYNPYVKEKDGTTTILPAEGDAYIDRKQDNPYYIKEGDVCYQAFTERGFTWGGNWNSLKDYQHFEMPVK